MTPPVLRGFSQTCTTVPARMTSKGGTGPRTDAATARGHSGRESTFGRKVCRNYRYARREEAAAAQSDADTLREKDLVIFGGNGCHHHSKHFKEAADESKMIEVTSVECTTTDNAYKEKEKGLN